MRIVAVKIEDSGDRTYMTVYGGRDKNRHVLLHQDITGETKAEIREHVEVLEFALKNIEEA